MNGQARGSPTVASTVALAGAGDDWLESGCFSALVSCPSTMVACPDVLGPTVGALLVSALAAGLIFLVAGGLTYLATGTSWQPTDREGPTPDDRPMTDG